MVCNSKSIRYPKIFTFCLGYFFKIFWVIWWIFSTESLPWIICFVFMGQAYPLLSQIYIRLFNTCVPLQPERGSRSGIEVLVSAVRNHHVVISEGKFIFMDLDLNVLFLIMVFYLQEHSFHIVSSHIYLPSLYPSIW